MTFREAQNKLQEIVNDEIKNSGWWVFGKRNLSLSITRILEPFEKMANLPLPESLDVCGILIDKHGITFKNGLRSWEEICATGIKTEAIYDGAREETVYEHWLMIVYEDGKVQQCPILCDMSHLKGQLGHFIESYKQEK